MRYFLYRVVYLGWWDCFLYDFKIKIYVNSLNLINVFFNDKVWYKFKYFLVMFLLSLLIFVLIWLIISVNNF